VVGGLGRIWLAFAATAVAATVWAAEVPAATVYDPVKLGEAPRSTDTHLVVDSRGITTVVWTGFRHEGSEVYYLVKARRIYPDGSFGAEQLLSEPNVDSTASDAAVDGDGRVTVSWTSDGIVHSRRINADTSLDPIKNLSPLDRVSTSSRVVAGPGGRTTVVWEVFSYDQVQVRSVSADGAVGPLQTLSAAADDAITPEAVVDGSGRVTVAWESTEGANRSIRTQRLNSNGTLDGPIRTVSNVESGDSSVYQPALAVDSSGRVTVVWSKNLRTGFLMSESWVQHRRLGAGGPPDGPIQDLSPVGGGAKLWGYARPDVAVDSLGRATVVWTRADDSTLRWVQSRRVAENGSLEPLKEITGLPPENGAVKAIVAAAGPNVTTAWQQPINPNMRVRSASLDPFTGDRGPIATRSTGSISGDFEDAGDHSLGVRPDGTAVVVWKKAIDVETSFARVVPVVSIVKAPKAKTKKRKAVFQFLSDEAFSSFECKLDKQGWKPCGSPVKYGKLKSGKHVFSVRASLAGSTSDVLTHRWKVQGKKKGKGGKKRRALATLG